jgi:guanosine-3',5'-bis(diphosphate) 3'-pyrophosphohydrolase
MSEEMSVRDGHHEFAIVVKALHFASIKHRDQRRKDGDQSPYINHPIALVHVLAYEAGIGDSAVLAAAALHDTVEDTATSLDELEREFGVEIRGLVAEVTDDKSLPKAERKALQIEHAAHASPKARQVKLADKICNIRDIAHAPPASWSLDRKREYFEWAKRVVDALRGQNPTLEALFDEACLLKP